MRREGMIWGGLLLGSLSLTACQPGAEQTEIDPGAIPAAPDMRPGTEAAPGGVIVPGADPDTVAGMPREPVAEQPPAATTP
jgi:hypothetical protein